MSVAAQRTTASPMKTGTDDVDMLSVAAMPAPTSDSSPSLATQCIAFQARIDSYASELNRLEAINKAIHEHHKRQQEQRRDRLIDSASPEPKSAAVGQERYQMVMKKTNQRRRRLTRGLEVVREGMEKLKVDIESVWEETNVDNS